MPSERVRRRIERMLDEIEQAADVNDWASVIQKAENVLRFDLDNEDAQAFLEAANRDNVARSEPDKESSRSSDSLSAEQAPAIATSMPTSFANGRYTINRFLGEGGKKQVYLAQDTLLDREVAFALMKTEGLDDDNGSHIQHTISGASLAVIDED